MNKITYGTFSQISDKIINENGDIRKLVRDLFSTAEK